MKGYSWMKDEGIRMKVYMSFRLLPPTSTYYTLPYLPQVKVKRWRSEKMQAPYKEQKTSNAVHLPLYWNVLSFSFTIIECSLDISFWVAMQHTFIVYFL